MTRLGFIREVVRVLLRALLIAVPVVGITIIGTRIAPIIVIDALLLRALPNIAAISIFQEDSKSRAADDDAGPHTETPGPPCIDCGGPIVAGICQTPECALSSPQAEGS